MIVQTTKETDHLQAAAVGPSFTHKDRSRSWTVPATQHLHSSSLFVGELWEVAQILRLQEYAIPGKHATITFRYFPTPWPKFSMVVRYTNLRKKRQTFYSCL